VCVYSAQVLKKQNFSQGCGSGKWQKELKFCGFGVFLLYTPKKKYFFFAFRLGCPGDTSKNQKRKIHPREICSKKIAVD